MLRTAIPLVIMAWLVLEANPAEAKARLAYIGSATMLADGTIIMHLYRTSDGQFLDATFTYRVGDHDYQKTLAHIGRLGPGETRLIRPWPEK